MLRSIWTKTLLEGRVGLIGWSIALAAVAILYAAFYPSMNQEAFAVVMDSMPSALTDAFGWSDLTSAAGYLGSTVFGIIAPILLTVYGIGLGSRAVAGDEEAGTLDLLLAHPVSRARVVVERTLAMTVAIAIGCAAVFLAVVAVRVPAQLEALSIGVIAATAGQLALLGLTFGTLALAVGAATGRRSTAVAVAAVVAVIGYFGNTLARQVDAIAWLAHLSPFRYYQGGEPLRNGLQVGDAAVLLTTCAVLTVVAVLGLVRRDVGV